MKAPAVKALAAALLVQSTLGATQLIRTTWGVAEFDDPLDWEQWMVDQKADG